MSSEVLIRQATQSIWYNLPIHPSTFSRCQTCKKGSGRGGGPCLKCSEAQLALYTSKTMAKKYVNAAIAVRKLEQEMINGE